MKETIIKVKMDGTKVYLSHDGTLNKIELLGALSLLIQRMCKKEDEEE